MYEVLNKYLFQHKSISIPGLGSLVAESIPAVSDFANKQLLPVQIKFRFDKYFDVPDKNFFIYVSEKKKIADFEAIRWYNEFAADLRNRIRTGEEAVWQDIGVFKKDFGGEVVFEPYASPYEFYPVVKAERIIHADAKHSILVGDKEKTNYEMTELLSDKIYVEKESWWIYALILAAIGFSILFFHLYRNNMKWGASGNQQRIEIVQPK
ncbi:MAG: hypothetical protein ABJB86_05325 [Bacteroidota bacterium]